MFLKKALSLLYIMEFCIMPWDFFPYTDYVIWTGYEGLEYELPCYVKYDNLDEINLELYRS